MLASLAKQHVRLHNKLALRHSTAQHSTAQQGAARQQDGKQHSRADGKSDSTLRQGKGLCID
jgi:hypothetical protein